MGSCRQLTGGEAKGPPFGCAPAAPFHPQPCHSTNSALPCLDDVTATDQEVPYVPRASFCLIKTPGFPTDFRNHASVR